MTLSRFQEIQGWELGARDGHIGRCHDLLFDDTDWAIRYLVADTRAWLPGRKVLISPLAAETPEKTTGTLALTLTKDQIRNAPPLDSDAPVSRRYEIAFNWYYDWPNYWTGPSIRNPQLYPTLLHRSEELRHRDDLRNLFPEKLPEEETHLHSAREVAAYRCLAAEADIGDVDDFLVDHETWTIRYLMVDARNWLPGEWLLIPARWVARIDWAGSSLVMRLARDQLAKCPRFDPNKGVDREFEQRLHDFYGMPYYWRDQSDHRDRAGNR